MEPFSLDGYRKLLESAAASGYSFDFFGEETMEKWSCLLRHDIDADLNAALSISRTESDMGARSTFFVMTRSSVYNLFSRVNHLLVDQILMGGHRLGLHYDEGFYPANKLGLQELVANEIQFVERMFGTKISAVSFHQPSAKILRNDLGISGWVNTYDRKDMEGYVYLSDSNMHWKSQDPWNIFKSREHPKIQLLTHPIWWVGTGKEGTEDLWKQALLNNFIRTIDFLHNTEGAFGNARKSLLNKIDHDN